MDSVEPIIHSFVVKVWQEVGVGESGEPAWRGYVTHVPSGARQYFEDVAAIVAFVALRLDGTHGEDDRVDDVGASPAGREGHPPTPVSAEVEMDGSSNGLQTLKAKLKEAHAAVERETDELARGQTELKRLNDGQAALQRVIDDLSATSAAIGKQIASIDGQVANAHAAHAEVGASLQAVLSDVRRGAIEAEREAVDDELAAVHKAVEDARAAAADDQSDSDAATQAAAGAAAVLSAAQAELSGVAPRLQALGGQATRLAAETTAAFTAGHLGTAYLLAEQLKAVLAEVGELAGPEYQASLQARVADLWSALAGARQAADTTGDARKASARALEEVEIDLKARAARRDANLRERVQRLEGQWAEADRAAASTGSSERKEPHATGRVPAEHAQAPAVAEGDAVPAS
jgi:predicted  nucleic acid-binding Zn-ribbon protein